jgi:hypothetical protein
VGSDAAGIAEAAEAAPPRIPSNWPRIGIARPMLDAKSCGKTVDGSLPGPRTLAVLDEIWVHSQCQKMASRVDVPSASRLGQAKHANNNRIRANRRITPDHSAAARVTPCPRGTHRRAAGPRKASEMPKAMVERDRLHETFGPPCSGAAHAAHNRLRTMNFCKLRPVHCDHGIVQRPDLDTGSGRYVGAARQVTLSRAALAVTGANCRRRSATQPP